MAQIEGQPAREFLAILKRSVKDNWPVSQEQRAKSTAIIAEIIENAEGRYSAKDVLTATKVQLEMDNSNIRNALAVDQAELSREKFEKLSNLENLIQNSLADGPPAGPIVSDTPMAAIEYIDVEPEEPTP